MIGVVRYNFHGVILIVKFICDLCCIVILDIYELCIKVIWFKICCRHKTICHFLTLYSPRAYKFVRKSLHLPIPSTIRTWATSIEYEPGFLSQVIQHLQDNLEDDNKDCILLVDEMTIKKEVLWDAKNKKSAGNIDYGRILAEEQDTIAHNVLVVMAAMELSNCILFM